MHSALAASRDKLLSSLSEQTDLLIKGAIHLGRCDGLNDAERLLREAATKNVTLPVEVRKIFSSAADQLARMQREG